MPEWIAQTVHGFGRASISGSYFLSDLVAIPDSARPESDPAQLLKDLTCDLALPVDKFGAIDDPRGGNSVTEGRDQDDHVDRTEQCRPRSAVASPHPSSEPVQQPVQVRDRPAPQAERLQQLIGKPIETAPSTGEHLYGLPEVERHVLLTVTCPPGMLFSPAPPPAFGGHHQLRVTGTPPSRFQGKPQHLLCADAPSAVTDDLENIVKRGRSGALSAEQIGDRCLTAMEDSCKFALLNMATLHKQPERRTEVRHGARRLCLHKSSGFLQFRPRLRSIRSDLRLSPSTSELFGRTPPCPAVDAQWDHQGHRLHAKGEESMSWPPNIAASLLLALAFLMLFAGVVLPAVWSSRPSRRRAAAEVLAQLLSAVRGNR